MINTSMGDQNVLSTILHTMKTVQTSALTHA
jgi:hypothetical protein